MKRFRKKCAASLLMLAFACVTGGLAQDGASPFEVVLAAAAVITLLVSAAVIWTDDVQSIADVMGIPTRTSQARAQLRVFWTQRAQDDELRRHGFKQGLGDIGEGPRKMGVKPFHKDLFG